MSARYTSELANDFGNLASRLIAMIEKYCDGTIPAVAKDAELSAMLETTVASADRRWSLWISKVGSTPSWNSASE